MKSIRIFYFSGTGGTKAIVEKLAEYLSKSARVSCESMEDYVKLKKSPNLSADKIGLAFPIYAFDAPTYVNEFVKLIPSGEREIFVLNVSGGGGDVVSNLASTHYFKKRLKKRGLTTSYEASFKLPGNWASGESGEEAAAVYRAAMDQCESVAEDILSDKEFLRVRPPFRSRFISVAGRGEHFGAKVYGRFLHATDACTDCGWCVANCPAENIQKKKGKLVFGDACAFCMRCVYGCPEKAIKPGFMKFAVLKEGYDVKEMARMAEKLK